MPILRLPTQIQTQVNLRNSNRKFLWQKKKKKHTEEFSFIKCNTNISEFNQTMMDQCKFMIISMAHGSTFFDLCRRSFTQFKQRN